MHEPQPTGMQGLAVQEHVVIRSRAPQFTAGDLRVPAILPIAEDGMPHVAQVDPDLVRPARLGKHLDGRVTPEPLVDLVEGLRRLALRIVAADGHLLSLGRMHADRLIDHVAVPLQSSDHDRKVLLLDLPILEQRGELPVGQIVLGHQDCPARVAVQAVNDTRPSRPADRTELARKTMLEG